LLANYKIFSERMILRDYLALDRTILAIERTLLSYIRTCVGLLASGIGLIHLIELPFTAMVGYVFIAASPFFAVYAAKRYIQVRRKLITLSRAAAEKETIINEKD